MPGAGKMIRAREHRVPEQSLTFTNHPVWRGGKDRSRLAAGLSHAAGMAQQVPPTLPAWACRVPAAPQP